jgi:hypothetical protein
MCPPALCPEVIGKEINEALQAYFMSAHNLNSRYISLPVESLPSYDNMHLGSCIESTTKVDEN